VTLLATFYFPNSWKFSRTYGITMDDWYYFFNCLNIYSHVYILFGPSLPPPSALLPRSFHPFHFQAEPVLSSPITDPSSLWSWLLFRWHYRVLRLHQNRKDMSTMAVPTHDNNHWLLRVSSPAITFSISGSVPSWPPSSKLWQQKWNLLHICWFLYQNESGELSIIDSSTLLDWPMCYCHIYRSNIGSFIWFNLIPNLKRQNFNVIRKKNFCGWLSQMIHSKDAYFKLKYTNVALIPIFHFSKVINSATFFRKCLFLISNYQSNNMEWLCLYLV
jgi:hypothetical protein